VASANPKVADRVNIGLSYTFEVNNISYRRYKSGNFTVRRQGRYYVLYTNFGLKVEQSRSNVRVTLPSVYKGKVTLSVWKGNIEGGRQEM